jgi:trans-aconitate methyltransferase
MDHSEMVALIADGVATRAGTWAELGAGRGAFTAALRALLRSTATIYAVDRDGNAVRHLRQLAAMPGAAVVPQQADFTRPLQLPQLDGLFMANALHFVPHQQDVLAALCTHLRTGGRVLLVEYDLQRPTAWVPFPVPPARFEELATAVGLAALRVVGVRRSPSSGIAMYAAMAVKAVS